MVMPSGAASTQPAKILDPHPMLVGAFMQEHQVDCFLRVLAKTEGIYLLPLKAKHVDYQIVELLHLAKTQKQEFVSGRG